MTTEKHIPYFAVVDAFNAKECPICFLIKERIEKYFNNLLYENINDIGFRKKFRKNYGFCTHHSYKFLNHNDELAISITHRDLLIDTLDNLKRKSISFPKKEK